MDFRIQESRGWGQGGEMYQALYAHMNNKRKMKKKIEYRKAKLIQEFPCRLIQMFQMFLSELDFYLLAHLISLVTYSFFWGGGSGTGGLNSGLRTGKANTVLLEPHLQSILLWLF
jgi:hypothetical protein